VKQPVVRKFVILTAAISLFLAWGISIFGLSETLTIPVYTRTGLTLSFDLDVLGYPGALFPAAQTDTTKTYTNGVYRVQVIETDRTGGTVIRVVVTTISDEPFWVTSFAVTGRVPRGSIQGVWYPSTSPTATNVMTADASRSVSGVADANYGIPYVAAAAANLGSAFGIGLGRQDLPVSITGRPAGGEYEFRLKATTARTFKLFDESFYVSRNPSSTWFDSAADYASWVDALNNYQPFPVTSTAYEPVYDTWYWSADHVDDRVYMETANLASEAGFGLFLADSGWDTADGEYDKWLNGRTGDYSPPADKFADLPGTFSTIRSEEKLGIELWLQPFAVGRESSRYARTRAQHIQLPIQQNPLFGWPGLTGSPFALPLGENLESVNLCPRLASTQTYLRNLFLEMNARYHPDAYWIDFVDGLTSYCIAPHAHTNDAFGQGLNRSLDAMKRAMRFNNPNVAVHFRAPYANLNTKSYANIWQSEDSPGDFDRMRLNSLRMRPFSKGVVVASDQMYWPSATDEATVSRFIATSVMTGVPAMGPNLAEAPASTLQMIKAWLAFYRRYKSDLVNGTFSIFGQLKIPNHKIEAPNRTFAYIRNLDFQELPANAKTIVLVNATDGPNIAGRIHGPATVRSYLVTVFNRFLEAEPNRMRLRPDINGVLDLNIAVQQGGLVVLGGFE
jgi:hypothetical protein